MSTVNTIAKLSASVLENPFTRPELSEFEFFFTSGQRTLKFVCLGYDRADAMRTAKDAMRGTHYKSADENTTIHTNQKAA